MIQASVEELARARVLVIQGERPNAMIAPWEHRGRPKKWYLRKNRDAATDRRKLVSSMVRQSGSPSRMPWWISQTTNSHMLNSKKYGAKAFRDVDQVVIDRFMRRRVMGDPDHPRSCVLFGVSSDWRLRRNAAHSHQLRMQMLSRVSFWYNFFVAPWTYAFLPCGCTCVFVMSWGA
jgi:hypothetical protein